MKTYVTNLTLANARRSTKRPVPLDWRSKSSGAGQLSPSNGRLKPARRGSDVRSACVKAANSVEERIEREQSDFLADVNHAGHRLDFHSLRHTCGAWLVEAGESLAVVQQVMRHSTIKLTIDTYGHLRPGRHSRRGGQV